MLESLILQNLRIW